MRKVALIAAAAATALSCSALAQGFGGRTAKSTGLADVHLDKNLALQLAEDLHVKLDDVPYWARIPVAVAAVVCGVEVEYLNDVSSTCEGFVSSPAFTDLVREHINGNAPFPPMHPPSTGLD